MSDESVLRELLAQWRRLRREGHTPTPDELCHDCPEYVEELRRCIDKADLSGEVATVREGTPIADTTAPFPWPQIPGYEIDGLLGRGGFGIVYRARQQITERVVALKMIPVRFELDSGEVERFHREARLLASLQHPNIVQIFEVGDCQGNPFYSMEYVEGGTLADLIHDRRFTPHESASLVEAMAKGVQAAHDRGVLHRDLKPTNILVVRQRSAITNGKHDGSTLDYPVAVSVKIADFGLAKQLERDAGQTPSGAVVGTPSYMAPEQAKGGKDVGPASDVYSLGAILYELLTGKPPFKGATQVETLLDVQLKAPTPPRSIRAEVPAALDAICLKCLEKKAGHRYATAADLAADLARWQRGAAVHAQPHFFKRICAVLRRPLVVALLAAVLVASILFVASRPEEPRADPLAESYRILDEGGTLTVLGKDGESGTLEWLTARPGEFTRDGRTEGLSLHVSSQTLGRLLPAVRHDSYEITAFVRHLQGHDEDEVGLFFALAEYDTPAGKTYEYAAFLFTDAEVQDKQRKLNKPRFQLTLIRDISSVGSEKARHFSGQRPTLNQFEPAAVHPGVLAPWRKLRIVVRPERIEAFFDNQLSAVVTRRQWIDVVRGLTAGNDGAQGQAMTIDLRGGFGLLAYSGVAAFKDITIRRLSTNE